MNRHLSKEYKIVLRKSSSAIEDRVNELINDGWELQGGVSVSITDSDVYFTQALYRLVDKESTE